MDRLLLLRHGKSDWNAAFGSDHERPINRRGRREAAAIGTFLSESGLVPDRILCSTAIRTRETLTCVMEAAGWVEISIDYVDALYLAAVSTARRVINTHARECGIILVIGHEPTMSGLVRDLSGGDVDIQTATLATLQTPSGTADTGSAKLLSVINPKSLL